jgi:hypothetical protein
LGEEEKSPKGATQAVKRQEQPVPPLQGSFRALLFLGLRPRLCCIALSALKPLGIETACGEPAPHENQ